VSSSFVSFLSAFFLELLVHQATVSSRFCIEDLVFDEDGGKSPLCFTFNPHPLQVGMISAVQEITDLVVCLVGLCHHSSQEFQIHNQ